MCTYNGSLYVREQLDSILNQAYPELEVIVGDDASTDDTYAILQDYAARDPRIRIYRNETNQGYNVNFSKACSLTTGAYVAISDQDDIWEPDKVAVLVEALEADPVFILVHGISARFEEQGKPHLRSLKKVNYIRGHDIRKFFMLNIISGHSMMFRKELLAQSQPFPARVYYDWWLAANACAIGEITAVERVLVWHRMHTSNATGAARPVIPFYRQAQVILPALLGIKGIRRGERRFGEELLRLYQSFPAKNFSWPLFFFLLRRARIVFAHKKRVFPWISYIKHSFKYARRSTNA
jgi:glycosyltransferase involved in cell wall biosynthesis